MSICQNVPTIDSKSFIDNSNNKLYESHQSQNFSDKQPKRQKSNIYKDRNLTESPLILSKHFSYQNTHNHSSYIQKKRELMQHKIMQETQMDIRRKQSSFLIQTLRKRVNQIQMSSKIQEIIRKKMKNIIQDLSTRRLQSLNYRHYLIFKDLSTIDSQKIEVAKQMSFCNYLKQSTLLEQGLFIFFCFDKIKTFPPNHAFIRILEFIELFLIVFISFVYSIYIFFLFDDEQIIRIVDILGIVGFLVATISKLNTGFFSKQFKLIMNKKKIWLHRRKQFIFDLITISVLAFNLKYTNRTYFNCLVASLFFLKWKTFLRLSKDIEDKLKLTGNYIYAYDLIKLGFQTVILCHINGTLYHCLGLLQLEYIQIPEKRDKIWLDMNISWSFRYTQSFFEAMSTMIGQPNKGETVYELAFSTIMLFSTIGMFATIINTVSMILDEIRQKQQEYRKNKEILNQFYNSQQGQYISQELKIQLLNYLRYFSMGHKELKQTQELQKVLKNFPEQLRKNVQRSRYTTLIRKFNILTDNFTNIILDSLVEYVEELYIMPNQIVFKKGIHTEPRLYLVLKGEISLEYQINVQKQNNSVVKSRKLKTVSEGQIFGEREFFSGLEADYTARSNTFSTILSIPRNEFIAIIKDIETDYQQFRYFQDQIVLTGSCPKICKRCKICFKDWHMENKCTLLQYVPNKLNLILRESKGQINKYSQRYFRRDRIYFNYYDVFKGHRKIVTNKYDKVLKDNIKEIKMIVEQMFERVYLQDDAYHNELIQSADIMEQTSSIMTDEDDEDDYFDEEEEQRYLMQVQNEENSSDTLPSPDYLRVDSQNQKYTDQQKQSQNEIKFDKKNWKYKNQYKTIKEENSTLMSQSYRKEPTIIIDTLEDEQQNEMEGITERKSHRSTKIEQTRLKPKLQSIYIQGDNTYNQKKENSLKKKYLKIYNNYANLLNVNQKTYSQASQAQKQAFKFVTQQKTSEKNSNTNSNNLDFPDDFSNMSPNQQPIRTKRTKTGSIILNEDAASFKNIRPKKISSGNNLLHPNNFVQRKSILNNLKNNSQQSLSKLDANKGKNMMNMSKLRNINALQNVQDNNNNPILAQIQNLVKQNMERRQSLQRVSFLNALSMANSKQYTPTSMAPYEGSVGYQVNKDLEKINKHKEEKYRGFWPLEIDAMKQYKIYFTQNNCEIILEQRLRKQLKWIESSRARKNFYKTQFISKYGTIYTENFNQNIKQKQKLF